MQKLKISVIMGAYNVKAVPTLNAAMESICNQTEEDYEFLICDDGSTDGTWELLQGFAEQNSRIRILKNPKNQGLAAALNHCLQNASGAYIARQDADDISAPDRFKKQLDFLEQHSDISFVGSDVVLFDMDSEWGRRSFPPFPEKKDFLFTMPFVHGSLMFRREQLMTVGGYRVAKQTLRSEDYDLLMRMYAAGMCGANIQEPLYRFLEDQATMKRRKYRYRINEAKVRLQGFSELNLMPKALPYVIKPLVVGMIPTRGLKALKKGSKRKY